MSDPMAVLDLPQTRWVLFHPRREPSWARVPAGVRAVQLEVEAEVLLGGRLYPAEAGSPLLLFFHGNGEIAADYDTIAPLYNRMGISLLVMDYRGYGRSGGEPTAGNLLTDAVAAADRVESMLETRPSQLYVMGRSLGSAAAIQVALQTERSLAGLVLESAFADTFALLARMGVHLPDVDEDSDGFGNLSKIGQITIPTLVIHGQADVLIPVQDGRALYQHSGAAQKRLITIPQGGHNDLMLVGTSQYFAAIQSFFKQSEEA